MTIEDEFLRALTPSVSKAAKGIPSGAVHFGTDVGLRREHNEDRVAVLRWNETGTKGGGCLAVAVVDGMGGMHDGARCAAITVASYFSSLLEPSNDRLIGRVGRAAHQANRRVHDTYRGKGGATLSSVVIRQNDIPVTVNIGDSRIYGLTRSNNKPLLSRLSIDDTLKEAFDSEGDGLIQFIGIGQGLHPHLNELEEDVHQIILTSDGAHYVDKEVFSRVLLLAPDIKARTDRPIALARWLGGHDNITVATVDIGKSKASFETGNDRTINLYSAISDVTFVELPLPTNEGQSTNPTSVHETASTVSRTRAKRKTVSKNSKPVSHEQLAIDIEVSGRKDLDADR